MVSTADMLKSRAQPLDFVFPTVLRGTVCALIGAGGVGKSGFALQTGISVAVGRDVFHLWGDPDAPVTIKKGKVLYISAEDGKVDLPGKCGEHQLRNQEVFYGKREQTDAGVSA
ncbi:AAA family ATPase [Tabrizicola sp. TH137]|uniref:AAA family ATPase n=1 Tax=Tabrizicola sp. TH137 TaxID=2067452 RepID=UPI001304736D|nr:AAA family ATPase [Tabrizicola sp. TH137]